MPERYPIPHRLYEALPFIYLGGGILVARGLANTWGIVSGLILLAAGVLVGWKRWQYRREHPQPGKQPLAKTAQPADTPGPALPQLVWSADYESGHAVLDSQHRRLFELGNALLGAIFEQRSKLDVELLLDELIAGVTDHFCFEEGLLAGCHHPHAPDHQATHRTLLARCKEMTEQYHKGHLKAGGLIEFIVLDVVEQHIVRDDLKFLGTAG